MRIAYLLCNPHNPTESSIPRWELAQVADVADRFDVDVISDEVHGPVVYADSPHSRRIHRPRARPGFAVHSAAKTFSLATPGRRRPHPAPKSARHLAGLAHGPNASLSGSMPTRPPGTAATSGSRSSWWARRQPSARRRAGRGPAARGGRAPAGIDLSHVAGLPRAGSRPGSRGFFLEEARVGLSSGPTFGPRGGACPG